MARRFSINFKSTEIFAKGGYEVDGREISPLDPDEINKIIDEIGTKDIDSIAVNSVYSPLNSDNGRKDS